MQRKSRVAKHYPPPSFLRLPLAKQWKSRVLVLTASPPPAPSSPAHTASFASQTQTQSSASLAQSVAHLHVFKSDGAGERELERVEIGAETDVYVFQDEVGGRRSTVRVGSSGVARMTLSMASQGEAQDWIAAIKHAVLSER